MWLVVAQDVARQHGAVLHAVGNAAVHYFALVGGCLRARETAVERYAGGDGETVLIRHYIHRIIVLPGLIRIGVSLQPDLVARFGILQDRGQVILASHILPTVRHGLAVERYPINSTRLRPGGGSGQEEGAEQKQFVSSFFYHGSSFFR